MNLLTALVSSAAPSRWPSGFAPLWSLAWTTLWSSVTAVTPQRMFSPNPPAALRRRSYRGSRSREPGASTVDAGRKGGAERRHRSVAHGAHPTCRRAIDSSDRWPQWSARGSLGKWHIGVHALRLGTGGNVESRPYPT